jgi:hypothetical protein
MQYTAVSAAPVAIIVIVLFLLLLAVGIALIFNKSTRIAGVILLAVILLPIILGLPVFFFVRVSAPAAMPYRTETARQIGNYPEPLPKPRIVIPPPIPAPEPPAVEPVVPPAPSPAAQKEINEVVAAETARYINVISDLVARTIAKDRKQSETPVPVEKMPSAEAAATSAPEGPVRVPPPEAKSFPERPEEKRPDWIGTAPRLKGDVYQIYVQDGPYADRQECDARKPEALQQALDRYVAICLGEAWRGKIRLPEEKLLHLKTEEYEETQPSSVGLMTNLHLLVKFDPGFKDRVLGEAKHEVTVRARLHQAGAALAGTWLALGVVWGYLRLDLRSGGKHRGRLRLAAALMFSALAAAVWWAMLG